MLTVEALLGQKPVAPTCRIPYGPEPSQFGDLFLPKQGTHWAVVALIHGGCWLAEYDLAHLSPFASALTTLGFAVWNLEYRRIGEMGGGWPGTFCDVAAGISYLNVLAADFPMDISRVLLVGHSAGGHLALWAAGWRRWQYTGIICLAGFIMPAPRGVLSLAGIPDLAEGVDSEICDEAIQSLLGSDPATWQARMGLASPHSLLPLGAPQVLLCGEQDEIVAPQYVANYARAAAQSGDDVLFLTLPTAGHYELVIPYSSAWSAVCVALTALLEGY